MEERTNRFKVGRTLGAAVALLAISVVGVAPARSQGVVFGIVEDPAVTAAEVEAALSPHGDWVDVAPWGRVWRPDVDIVGDDFAPYLTNGRWMYGAYGWTFNSNYSWGWAAFHFGRWFFHSDHGWIWTMTGAGATTWGPGWVSWRTGGGYVGWLPQLPVGVAEVPHQYASLWSVVHLRQLQRPDLARYLFPPERIAFATPASPPAVGAPVPPLPSWRGYPRLREAIAASNGTLFFPGSVLLGPHAGLWVGSGSSVHAPADAGQAAGASHLWTGPGASVFASPGFGAPALGQQPRGWTVTPAGAGSLRQ